MNKIGSKNNKGKLEKHKANYWTGARKTKARQRKIQECGIAIFNYCFSVSETIQKRS